jgi:FkbM family methyltransferase
VSNFESFNRLKQCRHGLLLYNIHDLYIGRSLDLYGEFSEGEIELFGQFLKPGMVAVEVGANIGAHTVFLAQAVGPAGQVLAFEPQRVVFQTLCANLALNSITNVRTFHTAVGQAPGEIVVPVLDCLHEHNFGGLGLGNHAYGERVPLVTLDSLQLPVCHLLKIDVEGMEQNVLEGARETIQRLKPILYVENDRRDKAAALIRYIDALDYNMYWHTPPLFNPQNYSGNSQNAFGTIVSINMLCCPKSLPQQIVGGLKVEVPGA